MSTSREEHVFVLRVWKEPATSRVGWRASVVHLIVDFIALRIAARDEQSKEATTFSIGEESITCDKKIGA
jgi:hypothetical protein